MTSSLSDNNSSLSSASNTLSSRATSLLSTLSGVTGMFSNLGTKLGSFISDLGRRSTSSLDGITDISSLTDSDGPSQKTEYAESSVQSKRPAKHNQILQQRTFETPQPTTNDSALQTIALLRQTQDTRGPKSVIPVVKQGIKPIESPGGQLKPRGGPQFRRPKPPLKDSAWNFMKR